MGLLAVKLLTLIKLTLMMIILTNMIQKLMFLSLFRLDLLLDIIYLNNVKHEKTEKKKKKKDRRRINEYAMASNISGGLVYDKQWKVVEW